MAGGSKGAKVDKNWNTATTTLDPATQGWKEKVYGAADAAGGAGPGAGATAAQQFYENLMKSGNLGLGAMSGDPNAVGTLMDPYQKQVIDANNAEWAHTNTMGDNAVADAATKAKAFGGSRAAVAQGVMRSNNNRAQQTQTAGLLSSGFAEAMQRAAMLAQGGAGGASGAAQGSMNGFDNPDLWKFLIQKGAGGMPYGTSTGTTSTGVGANTGFKWGIGG